jgi:hypothetical protein
MPQRVWGRFTPMTEVNAPHGWIALVSLMVFILLVGGARFTTQRGRPRWQPGLMVGVLGVAWVFGLVQLYQSFALLTAIGMAAIVNGIGALASGDNSALAALGAGMVLLRFVVQLVGTFALFVMLVWNGIAALRGPDGN